PATADPWAGGVIDSGAVVGIAGGHGGAACLGIPYARPPVGERRWRAPEPLEPWPGTREAVRFAPPCAQIASPFGGIEDVRQGKPAGSEDCLYLNVRTPSFPERRVPSGQARPPARRRTHGGRDSVGRGRFTDS